jgi:hypothetical protein
MKKTKALLVLLVFAVSSGALAQPVPEKKFEFSASASFSSMKDKDWHEAKVLNVALNFGYFIYKGLEIEPEFLLYSCDVTDQTGFLFLGNVAYNFRAFKNVTPFVLAGIGLGQGFPCEYIFVDPGENVTALNFGGGIKYTVGNSAGLRLEYRFAHFMMEDDDYLNDNHIFLGICLYF